MCLTKWSQIQPKMLTLLKKQDGGHFSRWRTLRNHFKLFVISVISFELVARFA